MSLTEALNRQRQWRSLTKLNTAEAIVHDLPITSSKVQINTIFPPNCVQFSHNFHCSDADKYHRRVLNPNSLLYARGCVIICNNTPLGHVKFKGERTFLAWQTVQNKNNFPLVFGGIYSLEESLIRDIDCTIVPYRTWGDIHSGVS